MFKQFNLSSITLVAIDKRIDLKFNFDIEESSVNGDSIVLTTLNSGDHIPFKIKIENDLIMLKLDEWPSPNEIYQIIIEKEIKNISGMTLNSSIRRKLTFTSEIISRAIIESPYNFEKVENLTIKLSDPEKINQYYVEVARENKFYNLVYSGDVFSNNISPILVDACNGQYYVRARVQKDTNFGPWSKTVTFIYRDLCDCDSPEEEGPSADADMPSAWDDLVSNGPNNSNSITESNNGDDIDIEIEDELGILTYPENGHTPKTFTFEFDRDLDPDFGEIVIIKRDF